MFDLPVLIGPIGPSCSWLAAFGEEVVVAHPLEYEKICRVGADIRDEMSASGACRPPTLPDAQLNLFVRVFQRYSYLSSQDIKRVLDVRVMMPWDPLRRTQPDFGDSKSRPLRVIRNPLEQIRIVHGCPPMPQREA